VKTNMAMVDRVIRAIIALAIVALYFTGVLKGTAALILGIVAVVFLLTGLISFCPIYRLLGISTGGTEAPPAASAPPKA
jgi:hypothetical protein